MSNSNKDPAPGQTFDQKSERLPAGPFFYKAAILIDGEFFLRRFKSMATKAVLTPDYVARALQSMSILHARKAKREIYRIFFYDCEPFKKKLFNPISRQTVDYSKTNLFQFRISLHNRLRQMRKFALRLGHLSDDENARWLIKADKIKELLEQTISISDLTAEDVIPNLRQKQVDMKIGVDIASLVLKHQVDTIILVSGDGDFVPAAKLARREGVDFILDPMYQRVQPDLYEHIDGLHSVFHDRRKYGVLPMPQTVYSAGDEYTHRQKLNKEEHHIEPQTGSGDSI